MTFHLSETISVNFQQGGGSTLSACREYPCIPTAATGGGYHLPTTTTSMGQNSASKFDDPEKATTTAMLTRRSDPGAVQFLVVAPGAQNSWPCQTVPKHGFLANGLGRHCDAWHSRQPKLPGGPSPIPDTLRRRDEAVGDFALRSVGRVHSRSAVSASRLESPRTRRIPSWRPCLASYWIVAWRARRATRRGQ